MGFSGRDNKISIFIRYTVWRQKARRVDMGGASGLGVTIFLERFRAAVMAPARNETGAWARALRGLSRSIAELCVSCVFCCVRWVLHNEDYGGEGNWNNN